MEVAAQKAANAMTKSLSMRRRKFILALLALVEFQQEAAGKDRARNIHRRTTSWLAAVAVGGG
jgi:hypothetical protein